MFHVLDTDSGIECLQEFAESLRLRVQYLDTLLQLGSSAVPVSTKIARGTMSYPSAESLELAADSHTLLFSEQGCVSERCGAPRLQAAQFVTDIQADSVRDLLPNVALSSWVRSFFEPADKAAALSIRQNALQKLQSAAAGFADTATVAEEDWLKIVATVPSTQQVIGRNSSSSCQAQTSTQPVPGCECSIQLPGLFSHEMYGIQQVPIMLLDIALKQDVPETVIGDVQTAFADIFSAVSPGVCVTPVAAGHSKGSTSACTGTTPSAPAAPPEQHNCTEGWTVQLHHGSCSDVQVDSGKVLVPWFDYNQSSDVSVIKQDKVDFTKSSCSRGFEELPAPGEWTKGFCMATETNLCGSSPSGALQLVRLVVQVAGPLPMAATIYVDGQAVAWLQKQPAVERVPGLASRTQTIDTLLLLREVCKKLLIVYDDGAEDYAITDGEEVSSSSSCSCLFSVFTELHNNHTNLLHVCL